jgi:hypothetical protein
MNKKGQVTIFIVVGILIVAIVAVIFIFRNKPISDETSFEADYIENLFLYCMEEVSLDGLNYIGLRGGYYIIPEEIKAEYIADETSYYYLDSKKILPEIERIETELEKYILENFDFCIDFQGIEEKGFEVSKEKFNVSVNILNEEIITEIYYPVTLKKGEDSLTFEEFDLNIPLKFYDIYSASGEVVDSYSEKPGYICLDCLNEISNLYDLEIIANPVLKDKNDIWILISNTEEELEWRFVVQGGI